ncbi:TrbI/VirB10 family protein [Rickettsiales bacterium]|nr:TrbI/VirB10 family protein [Rickettsiales bacterium]MDB2550559.1 TrbI/VirB10 family protein [Rickettsiales bacterium]
MLKSNFKKQPQQEDPKEEFNDDEYQSNVPDGQNSVGTGKARKLINIIAIIALFGLVFYFIFSQESAETVEEYDIETDGSIIDQEVESSPPPPEADIEILNDDPDIIDQSSDIVLEQPKLPDLPALPDLPDVTEEDIYPTATKPVEEGVDQSNESPILDIEDIGGEPSQPANQEQTQEPEIQDPRKTPIMTGNIQLPPGNSVGYEGSIVDLKGNAIQQPIAVTPETPTQTKDLSRIIAQGKMLTAILETAINTEVPGDIRGIVSRDVYAESGSNILIPKGTRLFGSYSSNITRGQARVEINWTRIIRPDGLEITVSLKASDQYGRSGISGEVDNQYTSTVANALLTSVLAVGGALATDALINNDASTTTGSDGSVISTSSASAQVLNQVTGAIIDTVTQTIEESINISPIIRIAHGTKMTVIVSNDISLPPYKY